MGDAWGHAWLMGPILLATRFLHSKIVTPMNHWAYMSGELVVHCSWDGCAYSYACETDSRACWELSSRENIYVKCQFLITCNAYMIMLNYQYFFL